MPRVPQRLSQYPFVRLRVSCDVCGREGVFSVARLAERYGAEVGLVDLLMILTASCRWQRSPKDPRPRQYEARCMASYPDLVDPGPGGRPRLRVVGGGA